MIIGLGTDIVEIARIKKMVEAHGTIFLDKIFTDVEKINIGKRKHTAPYWAGRWAAKEALSKALGCGIGENCAWKDIEITNNDLGAPTMSLLGDALHTATQLGVKQINVSITHEEHYACATVILC
jgi:holo-[acyl-carrier protein] synthase